MKKQNRLISALVLVAFLFNTAVQDLAFAQASDYHKLAAPLKLSDLQGMEAKDVADIEMWFVACLKEMEAKGFKPINAKNLRNFADRVGETIFRPEGYKFDIYEAVELGDGVIKIKVERTDDRHKKRTYFIEYNTNYNPYKLP